MLKTREKGKEPFENEGEYHGAVFLCETCRS